MRAVTQKIFQYSEALLPEMQAEVLDFVHFLKQKTEKSVFPKASNEDLMGQGWPPFHRGSI